SSRWDCRRPREPRSRPGGLMSHTTSLSDARRRATTRLAVGLLLVGALVLVPATWVALGTSAHATVSAGTTPTGGSGGSSDTGTPSPSDPETDYGNGTGDPHANTDDEMTGRDLTPG